MRQTVDISGMPLTYEQACQRMLWQGLQHPDWSNNQLMALWEEEVGPSGAQIAYVCHNLDQIREQGYDTWLAQFPADRLYLVEDPPPIPELISPAEAFRQGLELGRKMKEAKEGNA